MQEYEVAFEVAAHPHRVWRLLHPKVAPDASVPRTFEIPGGSITILRDGDEAGEGWSGPAPSRAPVAALGGVARSWRS
jgi:hypothetical protein